MALREVSLYIQQQQRRQQRVNQLKNMWHSGRTAVRTVRVQRSTCVSGSSKPWTTAAALHAAVVVRRQQLQHSHTAPGGLGWWRQQPTALTRAHPQHNPSHQFLLGPCLIPGGAYRPVDGSLVGVPAVRSGEEPAQAEPSLSCQVEGGDQRERRALLCL